MGILRLFRYLSKKYPSMLKRSFRERRDGTLPENSYKHTGEWTLIDLNAIFHPCCQRVFEYGEGEKKKSLFWSQKKQTMTYPELEQMAFRMIHKKIEEIIQQTNPTKGVYLAVDGVPGMCKQAQQRQRRFKSALSAKDSEIPAEMLRLKYYGFDPNGITTGTDFMARLCKSIFHFVKYYKRNNKSLRIIYSDMTIPGEGEHKLMRFLEERGNTHIDSITIVSPDADMIMLGLIAPTKKVHVYRENIFKDEEGDYFFVDLRELKGCLLKDLYFISMTQTFDKEYAIRDYVLFSFMIGNDFLPNINSLEITNQGYDILYDLYNKTVSSHGHLVYYKCNKWCINEVSFIGLLKELADIEIKMIIDKVEKKYSKYPDRLLQKYIDREKELMFDYKGYRDEYYSRKLEVVSDDKELRDGEIDMICTEYIKGMVFVMRYYFTGIPSFSWFYPWHYAPLLSDLYHTASRLDFSTLTFEPHLPLSMCESLVGILPPSSWGLLPTGIREQLQPKIRMDPDFLEDFEIDLDGKQQEYEGICLLPFVTYHKLKKMFSNVKMTEEEIEKNKMGNLYKF